MESGLRLSDPHPQTDQSVPTLQSKVVPRLSTAQAVDITVMDTDGHCDPTSSLEAEAERSRLSCHHLVPMTSSGFSPTN